ncbi:TolC family outer membrane protein [Sansalvadorimonas sp. 2012CJ34-2]|uniref:TolC family outer membrane protein n=1 Tax=Parendozoicomonas callyspongiae TaxID=2942213 RepID=A0ABT0PLQ2_9GAMM|nr:TolC family outer membrane protein [Sansalvadorimonas sp. 2012CJ34-2]MCL6272176.1 TolC family outer membrane protein [Sansalvadorimonas sp. 2012CJ34-2]
MATKRLLTGISAAIMAASSLAYAAESTDLLQVYELALKNDAQLAAAQASLNAAGEAVPQSMASLLPQISASGFTTSNRSKTLGTNNVRDGNTHGWSAQLSQPLFNLSSWFTFKRAEHLTAQAEIGLAAEQQNLIMRVAESYFNVLRAEDTLTTAKAEEKAVKRQLEQTIQRFEVGLIAETDVHEARAAYDAARVTHIEAKNNVGVAQESLRVITNTATDTLSKLDKTMPVAAPVPADSKSWVNVSINQNLNLLSARKGIDAAESQLRSSRSGHAPTLNVVANYTHNVDNRVERSWTGAALPPTKTEGSTYSLQLNIPVFSGGATSSRAREAGYRLEGAQKNADRTLRIVAANARTFYNTVNADVDRVEARCQGIVSASSALKAIESGYEVGTRNIVDVLNAQRGLFAAQRDYLNARYDFIINTLKLKQNTGTLSPQDLKDLNAWMKANGDEDLTAICSGT